MAAIVPTESHEAVAAALQPEASSAGLFLIGEDLLASRLAHRVPAELFRILAVLGAAVLILLIVTFRHWRGVAFCLAVMALNLTTLLGAMSWLGISWNFFNLTALLLALGTGIDYSIHVLLALRKGTTPGNLRLTTGRALVSCCLTTTAGFASLVTARLDGLVSMGLVCALALSLNLIIALCILPVAAARRILPPAP
jgi:predicted RND superfamily exporter protein